LEVDDAPVDKEVKAAMAQRRERIDQRITTLRAEIDRLTGQLAVAEREREALMGLLALWESGPQDTATQYSSRANGGISLAVGSLQVQDAADLVVKLLSEIKRPLHYREIESELRARNWYIAGGADPANTLLAKYFDDARLYRPSRGVYAIRPDGEVVRSVGLKKKSVRRARGRR
jgi:hypothetical protein